MKKLIIVCTLVIFSLSSLANSKRHHKHRHKHKPSAFEVRSLNSPVKDGVARFSLKAPNDFAIDQVMFKVKNANQIILKEKDYSPTKLVNGSTGKELHIPISNLSNGFYRLFIRVRTEEKAKPKSRFYDHDYKNSYHDFVRFSVEKKVDVSMPDPVKNDATVAGIDSDGDGIRDDIQIWINQKFASDPNVRLGVQQLARAGQLRLLQIHSKDLSIAATRKYLESSSCLSFVVGSESNTKIANEFETRLLNTKDRLYASMRASDNFSGETIILPRIEEEKALCDFNIDNL